MPVFLSAMPHPPLHRIGVILTAALFATLACSFSGGEPVTREPFSEETSVLEDWYGVYFTQPGSGSHRGGPDAALADAIRQARVSVDLAAYDFSLWSLRDALISAQRRGVQVRMVTDSDNIGEEEVQALVTAGITVLGDRREGLMHNKFAIIDRLEVWSGSMNFTLSGAYRQDNNLVRIRSAELAEDYTVEFEEMFQGGLFGPGSPSNTPNPRVTIQGASLEVLFSPDDGVASRILDLLEGAQESIHFLAYSFTSDELAQAILERAKDGVQVAGVFDEGQYRSNAGTEFNLFASSDLEVRLDGNPDLMHHKVILIDRRIVITGSYNFGYNAETKNDENVLIIYHPGIAELFMEEFNRIFAAAKESQR